MEKRQKNYLAHLCTLAEAERPAWLCSTVSELQLLWEFLRKVLG